MNDDELKQLWQQQSLREPPSAAELVSAMQKQTTRLRRILDARDLRELLACVFVIIIFGVFYFTVYRGSVSRVGDLIVIGSTIFIAWKIGYTRRKTPPAPPGATVVESLRAELISVRAQSRLLGSVLWWYILPGFIGLVVATWGLRIDPFSKSFGTLIFVAIDAFIYWLNQRARDKQLLPLEAQLESLLHSAETGEPPDETHVANLRPIVLSMAAAEQFRPAEFKVAFWQIALYGEIAFVVIWFFLMLGLTVGYDDGKTTGQARETVAQTVPAATNRYSVVAQKVVGLINAGDYAGLQKLYNRGMSEAFPPKETSEFYTRLAGSFGNIEKFEGPTGHGYEGWTAFQLHCERGELTMSVALDAEDKISGIYFRPAYGIWIIQTLVPRIFSWQHLAWLVPALLAGLAYSRILQKMTERCVGISSVGVHLYGGRILILWDEIKEVRPLRILNIRSLWLIRESGEKTIMPWTSLERHSDLKAAVESFAPANHPIRKYMALLTRK